MMPKGPRGEQRPTDVIGAAVMVTTRVSSIAIYGSQGPARCFARTPLRRPLTRKLTAAQLAHHPTRRLRDSVLREKSWPSEHLSPAAQGPDSARYPSLL